VLYAAHVELMHLLRTFTMQVRYILRNAEVHDELVLRYCVQHRAYRTSKCNPLWQL